jgi:uncharacterized RDD family membrane protein YckC
VSQPLLDPFAPPAADLRPRALPDDGQPAPATRGARLGAAIIDNLLKLPFLGLFFALKAADLFVHFGPRWEPALRGLCLLPMAAYQWRLIARTGQSIGKRQTKVRIVRRDGNPAGFVAGVVLRVWVLGGVAMLATVTPGAMVAASLVSALGFVDALLIFTPSRRTLHDRIAGTRVIAS